MNWERAPVVGDILTQLDIGNRGVAASFNYSHGGALVATLDGESVFLIGWMEIGILGEIGDAGGGEGDSPGALRVGESRKRGEMVGVF